MNEYGKRVAKKMNDYMGNPDSIDNEVNDLQNAQEGVQVRGALAASVSKSFDKSVQAEATSVEQLDRVDRLIRENPQPSEVVDARGEYPILRDRFNSIDANMAETNSELSKAATKEELNQTQEQVSKKRDLSIPIGLNDAASDLLLAVQSKEGETEFNLTSFPRMHSVLPETTTFINSGANLFDVSNVTIDYYLNNNTGGLIHAQGFRTSPLIPMIEGLTYSLTNHRKLVFRNESREFVSGIDGSPTAYTFTANHNGFFQFSYQEGSNSERIQVVIGDTFPRYSPFYLEMSKVKLNQEQVEDIVLKIPEKTIDESKIAFVNKFDGKNLFDKTKVEYDRFINSDLVGYFTSEVYKLKPGTYTVSPVRRAVSFGYDGIYTMNYNTNDNNASFTFQVLEDSPFVLISGHVSNLDITQLEVGDVASDYERYKGYIEVPELKLNENQRKEIASGLDQSGNLVITKDGEIFTISSQLKNGENISIETSRTGSRNGGFNFLNTRVNGLLIHNNSDDITPIRTFSTVGANHGYTSIIILTVSGHGKSNSDLGSVWTDGQTEYTLLKIVGNDLTFGCPYTVEANGNVTASRVIPTANLSHQSGATNTSEVSIANIKANGEQLYPSTNKHSVKYFLDGEEINNDGTYYGQELQVLENYDVMDYKDIIDQAQANVGESFATDDIEGVVNLGIVYTFTKEGKCLISHGFKALKTVSIGRCGFLQSIDLRADNHKTKRYMPGIKSKSGYDFQNLVDLTQYNTNLLITSEDLVDPNTPPNRYVDLLFDQYNNPRYGFTMGYIPDKTNSEDAERLQNASVYWDMRSTKKSYPNAMEGQVLSAGTYKTFLGFRNYFSADSIEGLTNSSIVEDKSETYIYIDSHNMRLADSIDIGDNIGKNIKIVESKDFELLSGIVDANGVTYNVTSNYGYAILKLN